MIATIGERQQTLAHEVGVRTRSGLWADSVQDGRGHGSGGMSAGWKLTICRAGGWKFGGTKVRHSPGAVNGLGRWTLVVLAGSKTKRVLTLDPGLAVTYFLCGHRAPRQQAAYS